MPFLIITRGRERPWQKQPSAQPENWPLPSQSSPVAELPPGPPLLARQPLPRQPSSQKARHGQKQTIFTSWPQLEGSQVSWPGRS